MSAEIPHRKALELAFRLEDAPLISMALANVGEAIRQQGAIARAEQFLQQGCFRMGEYEASAAHFGLARTALQQGSRKDAPTQAQDSIDLWQPRALHRAEQVRAWLAASRLIS